MGLRVGIVVRPGGEEDQLAALRKEVSRLRSAGHRVRPCLTFEPRDGTRFAWALAQRRYDLVLAVGGDGTLNEVVNGLARSRWQPRLGVVPLGTANDFATGMGLPTSMEAAVEVAVRGRALAVDLARLNRRCFINVSTGGFGAEATESTPAETKRLLGPWAYLITGVKTFVELRPIRARFETPDGLLYAGKMMLFAVGNARQTGGGTLLTPRAELSDGLLDVVVVPALPRIDFAALLPDLRAGTHLTSPDVIYVRTPELRVEAEEEISANADGEPVGGRRFHYRIAARPLTVMVP